MNSLKLTLKVLVSRVLNFTLFIAKKMCSQRLIAKILAMKVATTSVLLTLIVVLFSVSISAQDKVSDIAKSLTEGVWLTGTDGSKIATYQKDGQWFGKLVASDNKDAPIGIDVLRNFTLKEGEWQGEVYSVKRDQLADATIEPGNDKLVIEVSIAFFSKTLEWHNEKQTKK